MFAQLDFLSSPLVLLALQGVIFAILLAGRFQSKRKRSDLFLSLLLWVMSLDLIHQSLHYLNWQESYPKSQIRYFLFSPYLALGPLIYSYTQSLLAEGNRWAGKLWLHYLPICIYLIYRIVLLSHDALSEEWHLGYEGEWYRDFHSPFITPILAFLEYNSVLLYLAFSLQAYLRFNRTIRSFFSDIYEIELRWIKVFLLTYCALFAYTTLSELLDAFIVDLSYLNFWCSQLFSAAALVFLGIKGYYVDLKALDKLQLRVPNSQKEPSPMDQSRIEKLTDHIASKKPFLKHDLTLNELANDVGMSAVELSALINQRLGKNFNEYMNEFRVTEFKLKIASNEFDHYSLLGVATECGFNSKASFNRVFKQITGKSPSEFRPKSDI